MKKKTDLIVVETQFTYVLIQISWLKVTILTILALSISALLSVSNSSLISDTELQNRASGV
jgi:hypothetical protein